MSKGNRLATILVGSNLGDYLSCNVTSCREAMWLLDHGLADDSSVLQHILQVHKITVVHMLGIVVRVMEMDDSFLVCINNFLR